MNLVKEITIDSPVPSTCAVMDWLKENNYPECDFTHIECNNHRPAGIISTYYPTGAYDLTKEDVTKGKLYNGMYRVQFCIGWYFYMPEVDKYYCMTL